MAADVISAVPDVRRAPLAAVLTSRPAALSKGLRRVLPAAPVATVPVAAFSSSI